MKKCIDCECEKELTEFELRKDTGKIRSQCISCYSSKRSLRRKQRYIENNEYNPEERKRRYEDNKEEELSKAAERYLRKKDKILARNKTYRELNKESCIARNRKYRLENPEKTKARYHRYYGSNKDIILIKQKRNRDENPEKIKAIRHKHFANPENLTKRRATSNAYIKHRRKTDPVFVLKERFKNRTRKVFTKKLGKKAVESITALLGCSPEHFKGYFEAQFTEGMTWEHVYSGEIEIDHKIPISIGNTEEQLIKLSHYTNLRPMWKLDNQQKSDSIPENVELPF